MGLCGSEARTRLHGGVPGLSPHPQGLCLRGSAVFICVSSLHFESLPCRAWVWGLFPTPHCSLRALTFLPQALFAAAPHTLASLVPRDFRGGAPGGPASLGGRVSGWPHHRAREPLVRETIHCSTHWLVLTGAVTGDRTHGLGVSGRCSNQTSHLAGTYTSYF